MDEYNDKINHKNIILAQNYAPINYYHKFKSDYLIRRLKKTIEIKEVSIRQKMPSEILVLDSLIK